MSRHVSIAIAGCFLFMSQAASAHTLLTNPTPRSSSDGLKTGPCGGVSPTNAPMVVEGGETITISWLETVNHPGYYRIALSLDGDQGFDDNVLADNIADINCTSTPCDYSADVTFPDIDCPNCAMQLIQYMGNAAPYSLYFSCADIQIGGDGGGSPDAGPSGNGDNGGVDGGCSVTSRAGSGGIATLLLICLVLGYFYSRRK